jgi:hypothetical protein
VAIASYAAAVLRRSRTSASSTATPPAPWRDLAVAHPKDLEVVTQLDRDGDPEPIQRYLRSMREPGEQVDHLVRIAALAGDRAGIEGWVRRHGERSALPWAALAYRHLHEASRLHGDIDGDVRPRLEAFRRHLRDAESAAWCGHIAEPTSPVPWAPTFRSAIGLEIPIEEQIARYDRMNRLGWQIPDAEDALLVTLSVAGGTDDLMFAYAARLADDPSSDATRTSLPLLAHLEKLARSAGDEATTYREDPARRAEVRFALERTDARLHRTAPYARPIALNRMAAAASRFGHDDLAVAAHQRIGAAYAERPWSGFGDPVEVIAEDRARLGLGPR